MESREDQIERETEFLRAFQRQADEVSHLILNTDLPRVDVLLRIESLQEEARRRFPRKMDLFDRLYLSRFRRLWSQWRPDEPDLFAD